MFNGAPFTPEEIAKNTGFMLHIKKTNDPRAFI
jgi:hypothetical protein